MTVEERIAELQKQIDELKKEVKNEFKRADDGEYYYTVAVDRGKATAISTYDKHGNYYDDTRFENNNYFLTEERAKEVAEKINTLLKFERIYDMLCPDYKPDWNDDDISKCNISTDYRTGAIDYQSWYAKKMPTVTYFSEDKIEDAIKLYEKMS